MPLPALHLNTATIRDAALAEKFVLAANCGFSGLEMWINEVAPELLTGADIDEGHARFGWSKDISNSVPPDPVALAGKNHIVMDGIMPGTDIMMRWGSHLDAGMLDSLAGTMRICATLNARYIVLPALADDISLKGIAANLREIAALAREYEVNIGLEPMGHAELVNTIGKARAVLDLADAGPGVGIVLDSFHFFRAGEQLGNLASLARDQIIAVQINDAIALPLKQLFGNLHRTYPGAGIFDVSGFCEAVLNCGYDGPFTVEMLNPEIWSRPAEEVCREAFASSVAVLSAAQGTSLHREVVNDVRN
jgi:4-hydroxyphenylpyruvate dioxygenase